MRKIDLTPKLYIYRDRKGSSVSLPHNYVQKNVNGKQKKIHDTGRKWVCAYVPPHTIAKGNGRYKFRSEGVTKSPTCREYS